MDNFWLKKLNPADEYSDFHKFLQIVLILSHGNAAPERGFSVNKEIIVANQREESLIAQRMIYDSIQIKGGIKNVSFHKGFLSFMRKSYQRYQQGLQAKQDKVQIDEEKEKEERRKAIKIKELQEKRHEVMENFLNEKEEIDRQLRQITTAQK